jgi:chemotaxis protein MotB
MNRSKTLVLAVLVSLIAGACGYSDEEMQAERDRIEKLRAGDKQVADKKIADLSASNAAMAEQLRKLGVSNEDQARSIAEQNKALEELRARDRQAQQRLATFKGMLDRFQKMIASGKLKVKISGGRMVVELAENILFDSGRADLKTEGQAALTEVAGVLASISDRDFQIAGHTDNIPIKSAKFPSNWHLSAARALTVATFLGDHGVPPERLSAAGYADTKPAAPNDTPEGRQQNRRIEIVLMPNLDELPDLSQLNNVTG